VNRIKTSSNSQTTALQHQVNLLNKKIETLEKEKEEVKDDYSN